MADDRFNDGYELLRRAYGTDETKAYFKTMADAEKCFKNAAAAYARAIAGKEDYSVDLRKRLARAQDMQAR